MSIFPPGGSIKYEYGPGVEQRRFLSELAEATEGSELYEKYLRDLDPYVRELLRLGAQSNYNLHYSFAPGIVSDYVVPMGTSPHDLFMSLGAYQYNQIFGKKPFQEYADLARQYIDWASNLWTTYQQLYGMSGQEAYDALAQALSNYAQQYRANNNLPGMYLGAQEFSDFIRDWASVQQASSGNTGVYQDQYQNWLNQYNWMLTPQQQEFFRELYSDLVSYHVARAQDNPVRNASFDRLLKHYLNPFDILTGVNRGSHPNVERGPLPIYSDQNSRETFLNWLGRLEGVSPEQRQRLQSVYDDLWARYSEEKARDPYAWASFNHFLRMVDPQAELSRLPETDQQQTFLNWVAGLRGLTPQQRSMVESRFAPIFAQHFVQQQANPEQRITFLDYLNMLDPLAQIRHLPQSSPAASQRTFGSRLRWLGF